MIDDLITASRALLDEAIARHFEGDTRSERRDVAGIVGLFSGGNDSTVLAHLFRDRVTHYGHANTGIGIEQSRQFVRDTCSSWGVPLLERHPPAGSTYRELVLAGGFPGPAMHWKMYHRLKLRAIEEMQRDLIRNPYRERVIFLAGRRAEESQRRTARDLPYIERRKSAVWVSPLRDWTRDDLAEYRLMHPDCPRNEVTDHLHMSGECLCGAFAGPDELGEIGFFYPSVRAEIEALEVEVTAAGTAPAERCRWGWGAYRGTRCAECVG